MSVESLIEELEKKINDFNRTADINEVGTVVEVRDGIVTVSGLKEVGAMEMVLFENNTYGIALNLEKDYIGVVAIGDYENIKEGDTVKRTKQVLSIPVSDAILGRIVSPLMDSLDGREAIKSDKRYPLEKIAPGVMEREPVSVPLQTGIKAVDSMIPIGRGQRELIIGDRQTGKTALAIDTILSQKGEDVICVYVAIGQKKANISRIASLLEKKGALEYTVIVAAGASDGAAVSYLAPYSGTAVAEYFMDQGKDVLIIYDDLSKHAVSYREVSLLLRRPPGREAYPGDVFYLHSRLLERSCRRNEESGGGSITALPIIETQAGDVSAYIPTNVISITDGQIFLDTGLFYRGVRPAINLGLSVSRVGSAAQIKSIKKVAGKMKLDMAQYRELEAFAQFASDLDKETKKRLDRGARITELLKQLQYNPTPVAHQVVLIYAVNNGFIDELPMEEIKRWEKELREFMDTGKRDLLEKVKVEWSEEVENAIKEALTEFNQRFN